MPLRIELTPEEMALVRRVAGASLDALPTEPVQVTTVVDLPAGFRLARLTAELVYEAGDGQVVVLKVPIETNCGPLPPRSSA